jgi:aryl carrier-like protein
VAGRLNESVLADNLLPHGERGLDAVRVMTGALRWRRGY